MYRKSSFVYISLPLYIQHAQILRFLVHITFNMHSVCASKSFDITNCDIKKRISKIANATLDKNNAEI